MKIWAIIAFTFREGLARKTIIGFAAISTLFLFIAMLVALFMPDSFNFSAEGQSHEMNIVQMHDVVGQLQAMLMGFITFIALILAVFATASILPRTMEKGNIDLLLSKPVSRGMILTGTTLGAMLIVAANVGYYIVGMWLITGLRTAYWNWSFLTAILPVVFLFFVLYSVIMLLNIATRSSALSMIVVYVHVFLVDPILENREMIAELTGMEKIKTVLDFFYYPLPKPDAISKISTAVVLGMDFSWTPIWTSAVFAIAMFALAAWLFRRKDF
jgi:ABC-type transport system involved in multi-copper enzyme maturation permease subunit